jgi:hypothetical protein
VVVVRSYGSATSISVRKRLDRRENRQRGEEPLEKAGLREGGVVCVSLRLRHGGELEDDQYAGLAGAGVVLAHDAGLPQPANVRDLVGKERLHRLKVDAGLKRS